MRPVTIFWAWQSDSPTEINKDFIRIALQDAADRINADSNLGVTITVDSDTEGVPGTPRVTDTILSKIEKCDIFFPDVTFVAKTGDGKHIPNPNVMTEYVTRFVLAMLRQ